MAASAQAATTILAAPITAVTLLEDRAQITREGKLRLAAGSHRIRIENVSPVVSDRSVVARGGAGVRIDDARVIRRWRIGVEERPPDAAALGAEQAALAAQLRKDSHLHDLLGRRRNQLEQALVLLLEGLDRELPYAKELDGNRTRDIEAFLASIRELDPELLRSQVALRDLRSRLSAVELRQRTSGRVDHHLACELQVDLTLEADAEVPLTLGYLVPCALWRPAHRATLRGDQLRFECEGAVWQATGEDWTDVALSFSTARSTQRSEPPLLADDLLQVRRRPDRKVDVAVREQVVATTGEGMGGAQEQELPGVDDGGESRLLGAAARATIAADGRLRRIPIFSFEAAAQLDRLSRPEKGSLIHLRSRQENGARHPILAGPVELLRESGYVGRGEVGFVAPSERFALGFGGDSSLRVRRETDERQETAAITGKVTVTRTVRLFLSNLDDQPARFRVEERIPVSEVEQVQITVDRHETAPLAAADAEGIVAWELQLPPHGTQLLKLVYKLVASSDVRGVV